MEDKTLKGALWLGLVLVVGLVLLLYFRDSSPQSQENPFAAAEDGRADLSCRVSDFPSTYISAIRVNLTSPHHWVHLEWAGPNAAAQDTGPFHSSPGRGTGWDCNDYDESRRDGSCCTPKGTRYVEGFNDFMPTVPECKFVTWFHIPRELAIHSHTVVPNYPASLGCVRLNEEAAQLIHNNAIKGKTRVRVDGEWTPPPDLKGIKRIKRLTRS